jgi:hypothetical protein
MKKLNGKFILSALLVSAMACSTAVTAGALGEYESAPVNYYIPAPVSSVTPSASDSDVSDTKEDTKEEDTKEDAYTEDALALLDETTLGALLATSDDVIELPVAPSDKGKITVQEFALAAIQQSGKTVVLNNVKDGYSITIDGNDIETPKAINLAMDISSSSKATKKDGVEIPANAIIIKPAQKGDFGLTLTLTFDLGDDLSEDDLYFFYIDDDGEVTDLTDDLIVEDGMVSVTLSHASEYVITDEDITAEDEVADDTPIDDEPDIDVDDEPQATVDDETTDTAKEDTPSSTTGGIIVDGATDANPVTGTGIVFGTLAVTALSAAAIAATSKKRK